MNQLLSRFNEILKIINETGLSDKLVIIGSWAYWIYQNYVFNEKISPVTLRTMDIDIFVSRNFKFTEEISLSAIFEKQGYRWFRSLNSEVDKFEKSDFKIEFLTESKGRGIENNFRIKGIGVNAITIRYLDLLNEGYMKVKIEDMKVSLPYPVNYALHKLIVAQLRHTNRTTQTSKKEKDISQGVGILTKLNKDEVKKKLNSLPKKWQTKIIQSIEDSGNTLLLRHLKEPELL